MIPSPASTSQPTEPQPSTPGSILIIGAGVFGLSTTLALLSSPHYDQTTITLLDAYLPHIEPSQSAVQCPQPQKYQNPHAASIDSSRIIRADYALPAYAKLAQLAQREWRQGFGNTKDAGDKPVYTESGVVLTTDAEGSQYVDKARANAESLGFQVRALKGREDVDAVLGTKGHGGENGYVNYGSGWADSGRALGGVMEMVVKRARERGGVRFERGEVRKLIFGEEGKVEGAMVEGGKVVRARLTILAAGAWSGGLVDLRGRAEARGQVVVYFPLREGERERLKELPVLLNLSTGMFVIPPVRDERAGGGWVLKIARHAFGYANPTLVEPEGEEIVASVPGQWFSPVPAEGERACRAFLGQTVPWLGGRKSSSSRICWYMDTPTGDFLVSYHPRYKGLFLATGGSGHAFKFLPVLGEKIVAAVEGRLEGELAELWRWREENVEPFRGTEDGSRGGERGAVLEEEWTKGEREGGSKL